MSLKCFLICFQGFILSIYFQSCDYLERGDLVTRWPVIKKTTQFFHQSDNLRTGPTARLVLVWCAEKMWILFKRVTPGVDRAGQDASSFIEGKSLEDSYSKLITNFLISKAFYHLGELKPPLKSLDASLQACQSLSTEGQNKEKRSVKSTVSSSIKVLSPSSLQWSCVQELLWAAGRGGRGAGTGGRDSRAPGHQL